MFHEGDLFVFPRHKTLIMESVKKSFDHLLLSLEKY